jgi:hypothetical protein
MLLSWPILDGIQAGRIDLIFRCWQKPGVRAGGTLLTFIGQLQFESVEPVALDALDADDARRAGYASLEALRMELAQYTGGTLYRITLGKVLPDPRVTLRETPFSSDTEAEKVARKLARFDAASPAPWTRATLEVIAARPAVRAASLCRDLGQERDPFKLNVRKLKALGLTESLEVGYRVSPRGQSLLDYLGRRK